MKETKTPINIKSLLSNIDKLNSSFFKNTPKNRVPSKQKEIHHKLHYNEHTMNQNSSKNENIDDLNNFLFLLLLDILLLKIILL